MAFTNIKCCMLSHVQLFATLWIVACQAPLSMSFSPGKNTGVSCHFFLQGIFPIQGSNPHLLHLLQAEYLLLSHWGSPKCSIKTFSFFSYIFIF